ncbi:MAG: hypothetical protein ACYTEZ_02330 [Planctomycetota bacterium]|jgi:hypothetical protein
MSLLNMGIVAVFAIAGPRLFGLVETGSSIASHALWGAIFGGVGGVVAAMVQRLFQK